MALLSPVELDKTGLTYSLQAAEAGGDTFENNEREVLVVVNTGGSASDVHINSKEPCSYGADHDIQESIPNDGEPYFFDFLPRKRFGDPVEVTYPGGETGLSVGVVRVPGPSPQGT